MVEEKRRLASLLLPPLYGIYPIWSQANAAVTAYCQRLEEDGELCTYAEIDHPSDHRLAVYQTIFPLMSGLSFEELRHIETKVRPDGSALRCVRGSHDSASESNGQVTVKSQGGPVGTSKTAITKHYNCSDDFRMQFKWIVTAKPKDKGTYENFPENCVQTTSASGGNVPASSKWSNSKAAPTPSTRSLFARADPTPSRFAQDSSPFTFPVAPAPRGKTDSTSGHLGSSATSVRPRVHDKNTFPARLEALGKSTTTGGQSGSSPKTNQWGAYADIAEKLFGPSKKPSPTTDHVSGQLSTEAKSTEPVSSFGTSAKKLDTYSSYNPTVQFNKPTAQGVDDGIRFSLFGDVTPRTAESEPKPSKNYVPGTPVRTWSDTPITRLPIPSDLFVPPHETPGRGVPKVVDGYKSDTLVKLAMRGETTEAVEEENTNKNAGTEPAQLTAVMKSLKSARFWTFKPHTNIYPKGIMSPVPAMNHGKPGNHHYDVAFLMQFKDVFSEKPSLDWDMRLKDLPVMTPDMRLEGFQVKGQKPRAPARSLKCSTCNRTFRSVEALDSHFKSASVHRFSVNCSTCNRTFRNVDALDQHLRDAPVQQSSGPNFPLFHN
jgi:hypothetical protein